MEQGLLNNDNNGSTIMIIYVNGHRDLMLSLFPPECLTNEMQSYKWALMISLKRPFGTEACNYSYELLLFAVMEHIYTWTYATEYRIILLKVKSIAIPILIKKCIQVIPNPTSHFHSCKPFIMWHCLHTTSFNV